MTYYGPWTTGAPTWWKLVRIMTFGAESWYNGGSGNWVSYYSYGEAIGDNAAAMEIAWDGTGRLSTIGADGGGASWGIGVGGGEATFIEMWMSIWRPASTDSYLPPPEQPVTMPDGATGVVWEQGPRTSHRLSLAILSFDAAPPGEPIYVKLADTTVGYTYDPGFLPRGTIAAIAPTLTFSVDAVGYLALDGTYPLFGDAALATALVDKFTQTHEVPGLNVQRGFPYAMTWEVLHTPRYRFVYDGDPPTLTPGRYMPPARLSGRMDGLGPLSGSRRLDTAGPSRQSGFHPGAPGSYY